MDFGDSPCHNFIQLVIHLAIRAPVHLRDRLSAYGKIRLLAKPFGPVDQLRP